MIFLEKFNPMLIVIAKLFTQCKTKNLFTTIHKACREYNINLINDIHSHYIKAFEKRFNLTFDFIRTFV